MGRIRRGTTGPDIYNYNLIERTDLTDAEERCNSDVEAECRATTETELVEFPAMECLGHYVQTLSPNAWSDPKAICADGPNDCHNFAGDPV